MFLFYQLNACYTFHSHLQDDVGNWMLDIGGCFKRMLRSFAETNESMKHLKPRNCSVSTMTVCGKLTNAIDMDLVASSLQVNEHCGLELAPASKKTKKSRAFFNQLTVKITNSNTSIKLFSNGAIHITGVRNMIHFADIMDRVCTALALLLDTDQPVLQEASISMINAIFSAARRLPLRTLRQLLEDAGYAASYDPDAYPGINAKITVDEDSKTVTVMIFTTGNVIISGAKTPEHVSRVYHIVCSVMDNLGPSDVHAAVVKPSAQYTPGSIEMYSIVNGYSSKIAHLCIDGS